MYPPLTTFAVSIRDHLLSLGIETPMHKDLRFAGTAPDSVLQKSITNIMEQLGLNLEDDSLKETPQRVAKMYSQEVFYGLNYANFPKCTVIENKMGYNEMISTKCSVKSMCEHHLVPFIGIADVAYIPDTKILGLSKFNRVVDFFSRRPQVQERLTAQITAALQLILGTKDVAVVIRATHYCVLLRGVEDHKSETITSQMGGKFLDKPALRQEFLALTR